MNKKLLVVKLGGSVVTYKDSQQPRARIKVIKQLAKEVKQLIDIGYRVVLVHGAGSYGHPIAKRYKLSQGMETEEQKFGYSKTLALMHELNRMILKELISAGVRPVSLPPHTIVRQLEGKFRGFDYRIIKEYLLHGFVPVLFGDGVLDEKLGCSILSGDTIVTYLATRLSAKRVIFLSDVDGIFDSDPRLNSGARLIPWISNENVLEVLNSFERKDGNKGGRRIDITGEMRGKILAIKEGLLGVEVYITNGLKRGKLIETAQGKPVGTKIRFA